ncbi:unnamed protein product (macronuclear) [Paramecium tetraurelia]|uniref:DHHA2 domain-containing protein n=1 Tax=Paramecium tetraurelia TaxID=5888 RepID=A0C6H2_PARTE|nr:uncharacterized protein GSPATT00035518001 [Paramecium tetraurelia]CAK66389.1 unnamed protein product [Paramecium tetraurelia]|eukprot:XP_001433786.1 hypothetical protein (macronuclear) [Paramecium tetraurelia strain d4-2]
MINQFLRNIKLLQNVKQLVLGNPTADMDSCIGSILLAYHMTQFHTPTAPIINYNRESFRSHFETAELFDADDLIFINEVDLNKYDLILYDHNDIKYTNNQIGCIDHHEDKGQQFSQFKKIEKVGSAVTLVAEYMQLEQNYKCKQEIAEIAQLIMKTILIDTFNFQQNQYQIRWVDKDKQIFDLCNSFCPQFDAKNEYQHLTDLKYDVKLNLQLSLTQQLLKDYKKFYTVGYSVIFIKLQDLMQKYNENQLINEFNEFMAKEECKTLIVFFVHLENNIIQRSMIIYGENQQKIIQQFTGLKFEQLQSPIANSLLLKDIDNIYSRKIIEPLVSKL